MIEQPAIVASRCNDSVLLQPDPSSSVCAPCATGGGCGAGALLRAFRPKSVGFRVATTLPLRIGAEVNVAVSESWLLARIVLVYGIPLVGLVIGASSGELFAGDAGAILGAAAGLTIGWTSAMIVARQHAGQAVTVTTRRPHPGSTQRVQLKSTRDGDMESL